MKPIISCFCRWELSKAEAMPKEWQLHVSAVIHYPVGVVQEDGWFIGQIRNAFTNKKEAELCKKEIVDNGILNRKSNQRDQSSEEL